MCSGNHDYCFCRCCCCCCYYHRDFLPQCSSARSRQRNQNGTLKERRYFSSESSRKQPVSIPGLSVPTSSLGIGSGWVWVAISFTADLLPKKWFWNSSRWEWKERVFFCFTRNERRPLIWDPSDKDKKLVFALRRQSSVFRSDYGISINGKIEKYPFLC